MSYVKHTEINFWHLPPPKLIVQIPRTVLLNEAYKQVDRGTYRIHIGAVYKGRPANGEGGGGGFEISDIPGREEGGWFVKVRTSENFSEQLLN